MDFKTTYSVEEVNNISSVIAHKTHISTLTLEQAKEKAEDLQVLTTTIVKLSDEFGLVCYLKKGKWYGHQD